MTLTTVPKENLRASLGGVTTTSTEGATRPLRIALGLVSLVSLAAGAVGLLLDLDSVRQPALLLFCALGIGAAPWQLRAGIGGYERLALTFLTGASVTTLVPVLLSAFGFWHPLVAFAAVVAVVLPMHVVGLLRARNQAGARHRSSRGMVAGRSSDGARHRAASGSAGARTRAKAQHRQGGGLAATTTAVSGGAMCLVAALSHRHLDPAIYGFLTEVGPLWYMGLALVLGSLTLRAGREGTLGLPVFVLTLVLTLTPALVYDGPRSQAAAKHIDFISNIQATGTLDSSVPVYNAFAGFFDAMAWISSVAGISDVLGLATFWPVALGVFRVVVLRYLAGQFLMTSSQCWVAVTLAVLADSLGADYFSPQSVGFVLSMATVAVAVTRTKAVPRLLLVLVGGVTLAVTHQLSPYVAGGVLVVLATFRVLRPRWAPVLVLGPAVVWSVAHWEAVQPFLTLDAFGQLSNFQPPRTANAPTLERLPIVSQTVWAALLGIGVVASLALVAVIRNRQDSRFWALASCSAVGIVIIVAQPYGQEGVFRAALFGIPWLAVLAATVLAGAGIRSRTALAIIPTCLTATFLIASFGLDLINVIRPSDYTAIRQFREEGGRNPPEPYFMLLLNVGDQPTSPDVLGGRHAIWGRDVIQQPVTELPDVAPEAEMQSLTAGLVRYTEDSDANSRLYAFWSPVGARYGEVYGVRTAERSSALRDAFASAPYWSVVRSDDGSYLFRFERGNFRSAVND